MSTQHITDAEFETIVLKSGKPVLVDFYAAWCGPCKMAAPVLDKLSDEFSGKVVIVKIDVDEHPKSGGTYGVLSIPTIIAFNDGKEVTRKVGFGGENGYRQMIDRVLGGK